MNEEALNDAYKIFVGGGYSGSIDEFKTLLEEDENAVNDLHSEFSSGGYKGDVTEFKSLLGLKKKDNGSESLLEEPSTDGTEEPEQTRFERDRSNIFQYYEDKISTEISGDELIKTKVDSIKNVYGGQLEQLKAQLQAEVDAGKRTPDEANQALQLNSSEFNAQFLKAVDEEPEIVARIQEISTTNFQEAQETMNSLAYIEGQKKDRDKRRRLDFEDQLAKSRGGGAFAVFAKNLLKAAETKATVGLPMQADQLAIMQISDGLTKAKRILEATEGLPDDKKIGVSRRSNKTATGIVNVGSDKWLNPENFQRGRNPKLAGGGGDKVKMTTVAEERAWAKSMLERDMPRLGAYMSSIKELEEKMEARGISTDLLEVEDFGDFLDTSASIIGEQAVVMPLALLGGSFAMETAEAYYTQVSSLAKAKGITIQEVIEQGLDNADAAVAAGVISGSLDLLGAGKIVNTLKKSVQGTVKKKILEFTGTTATEFATEFAQNLTLQIQNALVSGETIKLREAVSEGLAGMLMGGIMSSSVFASDPDNIAEAKRDLKEMVQSPEKRLEGQIKEGLDNAAELFDTGEKKQEGRSYSFFSENKTRREIQSIINEANTVEELEGIEISNDKELSSSLATKLDSLQEPSEATQEAEEVVDESLVIPEEESVTGKVIASGGTYESFITAEKEIDEIIEEVGGEVVTVNDSRSKIKSLIKTNPSNLNYLNKFLSAVKNISSEFTGRDLRVAYVEDGAALGEVAAKLDGGEVRDISRDHPAFYSRAVNTVFITKNTDMKQALAHEVLHSVVGRYMRANPEVSSFIAEEAMKDEELANHVNRLYSEESRNEEAIVESIANKIQEDIESTGSISQSIKDILDKLLKFMGLKDSVITLEGNEDYSEFASKLSKALKEGTQIGIANTPFNPVAAGIETKRISTEESSESPIAPIPEASTSQTTQSKLGKWLSSRRVGKKYFKDVKLLNDVNIEALSSMEGGEAVIKKYNQVVEDMMQTMPVSRDLNPAKELASEIKKVLNFSEDDNITLYSRMLYALDQDPSAFDIGTEQGVSELIEAVSSASEEAHYREFNSDLTNPDSDASFIKNHAKAILNRLKTTIAANEQTTKFSDALKGKYKKKEELAKNDIARTASRVLEINNQSIEDAELTEADLQEISNRLGGNPEFVELLGKNRDSITRMAVNDLVNKENVEGLIATAKNAFKSNVQSKFSNESKALREMISKIVKPKFSKDERAVLEDYMEFHEVRKLVSIIQSAHHGYLPPMGYGIIRKFSEATNALRTSREASNLSVMKDANGRLIRDGKAHNQARELTAPSTIDKAKAQRGLDKRTTIGANKVLRNQKNKVLARLYNRISRAWGAVESEREVIIHNLNSKFGKVKPFTKFDGSTYSNSDVNMLAHMYLLEKQYLTNPTSSKVPKLYESLISAIKDKNNPENNRYVELYEDFKQEDSTNLDMTKATSFLKESGALRESTEVSSMGLVNYVESIMESNRDRVSHLQEYQNKTEVELFENYMTVLSKQNANTGEVKASFVEGLLSDMSPDSVSFAKTSTSRQNYKGKDGKILKIKNREPVFDLMFAANYSMNEVLMAYHVGEEFRNVQAMMNIMAKMGDNETQVAASLIKQDVKNRLVQATRYKAANAQASGIDKFLGKYLTGMYSAYLASVRRFVELFSNSFMVGLRHPSVGIALVKNFKKNISQETMKETKAIMDVIGSSHTERFNKTGKAFYSAEGIGQERINRKKKFLGRFAQDGDGNFNELYTGYANAMNTMGQKMNGIRNLGDAIIRMSDTQIGSVSWNQLFKDNFERLAEIPFTIDMVNDPEFRIQYQEQLHEARDLADVALKEDFAGNTFDMNAKALRNTGVMKYLQNMFRTFRTFYYETNRDAVRSLMGMSDGTMEKAEAGRRLAGAFAGSVVYAVGSGYGINLFFETVFSALGLGEAEEEDKELEIAASNALVEFLLMSTLGKAGAIPFGLVSGASRSMVREYWNEDKGFFESLDEFVGSTASSEYLMSKTVPVISEPAIATKRALELGVAAIMKDKTITKEQKSEALMSLIKNFIILKGVPLSGDVMTGYHKLQRMNEKKGGKSSGRLPKKRRDGALDVSLDLDIGDIDLDLDLN